MKRLGIVALESSHVDQYCRIFNQPDFEHRLPDARITAICPQDENTQERVDELAGTYGIETVVATPEEMIGVVDSAMMLGRDGAQHCGQTLPFLRAGIPCFVDKPFAHTMEDADLMISTAREHGVAITTSSAIRHASEFAEVDHDAVGEIKHVSLFGPGELFFYGIHQTDILMSLMGPGVEAVSNLREETMDLVSVTYGDGRSAQLQLIRGPSVRFGATLFGATGMADVRITRYDYYVRQMVPYLKMIDTGEEPIPEAHMREAVQILVAADRSAKQGGRAVRLAEVYPWKRPF
jgi:predicted dehydrogenase